MDEGIEEEITAEESGVETKAEQQVAKELEPETLIHVTSGENATNININGLSALQYPDVAPSIGTPGAFYALGLQINVPYGIEDLVQVAVSLFVGDRYGSAKLAAMIGSLPGPVIEGLKVSGAIRQQNVIGPLQELVCFPESFGAIDEYNRGRWAIIPVIQ